MLFAEISTLDPKPNHYHEHCHSLMRAPTQSLQNVHSMCTCPWHDLHMLLCNTLPLRNAKCCFCSKCSYRLQGFGPYHHFNAPLSLNDSCQNLHFALCKAGLLYNPHAPFPQMGFSLLTTQPRTRGLKL